jgi:hypothetical protein
MGKLLWRAVNAALGLAVLQSAASLADPQCPASSQCPQTDANCIQRKLAQYTVCQNGLQGCCQWTKIVYAYSPQPGHACTLGNCGQWSGDPPTTGIFTSGLRCSSGTDGVSQGYCTLS